LGHESSAKQCLTILALPLEYRASKLKNIKQWQRGMGLPEGKEKGKKL
jgi:hypothetical protein